MAALCACCSSPPHPAQTNKGNLFLMKMINIITTMTMLMMMINYDDDNDNDDDDVAL